MSPHSTDLLQCHLLGEMRLKWGDQQLAPPPPRTQTLLAYLLLNPYPLQRAAVAQTLYPDLATAAGRKRISDLAWTLRSKLPMLHLQMTASTLHVAADSRWLDVDVLRQSMERTDWAHAAEVAALYKADLLPRLDNAWMAQQRERLRHQFAQWLRTGCQQATLDGDLRLKLVDQWRQLEPYDEDALGIQVDEYVQRGRNVDALKLVQQLVGQLRTELRVEPQSATLAWLDRLSADNSAETDGITTRSDVVNSNRAALWAFEQGQFAALRTYVNSNAATYGAQLLRVDLALLHENMDQAELWLSELEQTPAVMCRQAEIALWHGHKSEAVQLSRRAVLRLKSEQDPLEQANVLFTQARIYSRQGDGLRALSTLDKALTLVGGHPVWRARIFQQRADFLYDVMRFDEAIKAARTAHEIASENRLLVTKAHAANSFSIVHSERGELLDAMQWQEKSQQIWQQLDIPAREACSLFNITVLNLEMGQTVRALAAVQAVRDIYRALEDEYGYVQTYYLEALTLIGATDANIPEAIALLETNVLPFFERLQAGVWLSGVYELLTELYFFWGKRDKAQFYCDAAHAVQDDAGLGELNVYLWSLSALVDVDAGRLEQAREWIEMSQMRMAEGNVTQIDRLSALYALAVWQLASEKVDEARSTIRQAYRDLSAVAEQLPQTAQRRVLFRDPISRRAMQLVYQYLPDVLGEHEQSYVLPHVLNGEVTVAWTTELSGTQRPAAKTARRRAHLAKLVEEAREQDAAPTLGDFASILGVSLRTVRRDLAGDAVTA